MNAAKPVIVSDQVGCAPDLVRHKENGYIFRAGDIDDLCKGLRFVLSDSERCRAMGQKSLEIINRWGFEEDVIGLRKALNLVLGN
jgi:glycosyltransferase involved in cell wall biosynthesis